MTRLAVFAYGSLVDPGSASLTLGRPVPAPVPARLDGWRRRWSVFRDNRSAEKTFAVKETGEVPPWIFGLNVDRSPDATPGVVGALLEVTEAELDRLDVREMRYRRADVTADVRQAQAAGAEGEAPFDSVTAFIAEPAHHAPDPLPGGVVIAAYLRTVEAAFAAAGLLDEFRRTTDRPPVPVIEGVLVADRIPRGNPRDW